MRVGVVDQVVVVPDEAVAPGGLLVPRHALEVAVQTLGGAPPREDLAVLQTEHSLRPINFLIYVANNFNWLRMPPAPVYCSLPRRKRHPV